MKVLKRINVDKTMEMFAAAGIEPAQGNNKRCIMAAVLYPNYISRYSEYGWDGNYFCGVVDGWDGHSLEYRLYMEKLVTDNPFIDINLEYKLGRADGQAALKVWRQSQCSSNALSAAVTSESAHTIPNAN